MSSTRRIRIATVLLFLLGQHGRTLGFSVPVATTRRATPSKTLLSRIPRSPLKRQNLHRLFSADTRPQTQDADPNDVSSASQANRKEPNDNLQPEKGNKLLQKLGQNKRKVALSVLALVACSLGFTRRQDLLALTNSIDLKGVNLWLRKSLDQLNGYGNAGLAMYAGLMTLWTMTIGVTTPVETAAGFAFGANRAILANAMGKTTGALVAFFLGRFIFFDFAHKKLKNNELLQLVEESITEHPLLVAIMVRLSPLPEPVKNVGMSVLDIKNRWFVLSVLLHGFPFTCLWSCMGAETAKVVTLGVQPSTTLKVLVSGSTWFGVLLSPSLIGWWLNSLRAKRAKRHQAEAAAGNNNNADS